MNFRILQAMIAIILVSLRKSAFCKYYNIVPTNSTGSACHGYKPSGSCVTLLQLAESDLALAHDSHLVLNFLPGEHMITQTLTIRNYSHVQLTSEMKESVEISFHGTSIQVTDCDVIRIENLWFACKYSVGSWNQGLDIRYAQIVYINNSSFTGFNDRQFTASQGIRLTAIHNSTVEQSIFSENLQLSLYWSRVTFLSGNHFRNNNGSVYAFNSRVEFKGHTTFTNNHHSAAVCAIQSQIYFNSPEGITITNNAGLLGGGIFLSESTMIVYHPIKISHNTADYGGGIYAYSSLIDFILEDKNTPILITNNTANRNGGGVCLLASTVKIHHCVHINSNTAIINGGGMHLEYCSQVHIWKRRDIPQTEILLYVSDNSAQYGGGIFVDERTVDGKKCSKLSTSSLDIFPRCFMQTFYLNSPPQEDSLLINTVMTSNRATTSGTAIFGGMLDQCTVNPISRIFSGGLDYISKTIRFTNTSSLDHRCQKHMLNKSQVRAKLKVNCSNELYSEVSSHTVQVESCEDYPTENLTVNGESLTHLGISTLDQVGTPVKTTVSTQTSLFRIGLNSSYRTVARQFNNMNLTSRCTPLLQVKGPSLLLGRELLYEFVPGDEDTFLLEFIVTDLDDPLHKTHILRKLIYVNISVPMMYGECPQGQSLVLGASGCRKCSNVYLLLLIPFALAGVLLVAFILLFNITIATGTIYGLIFYANILASFEGALPQSSFLTVFISWVNLDLGIETCFYSHMNYQAKELLQLVFPFYLFLLVVFIIILSEYSNTFSKLLSNRNPVAALSTLIFLSYSKLLRFIITTLNPSPTNSTYNTPVALFTPDVSTSFTPSHENTPQLVAAFIILIVGGLFTLILFFSQWFSRCSNRKLMKWTRSTKYIGFMDTFHAPFTPKHRYWVGLLLLALIVHNIVAAVGSYLYFVSAGLLSVARVTLKILNVQIYKIWYKEYLETKFFLNIILFILLLQIGMVYRQGAELHQTWGDRNMQDKLTSFSLAVALFWCFVTICGHFYEYILMKTKTWQKFMENVKSRVSNLRLKRARNGKICTKEDGPVKRLHQQREPALDILAPITTDDYRQAPSPQTENHQEVTYTVIDTL